MACHLGEGKVWEEHVPTPVHSLETENFLNDRAQSNNLSSALYYRYSHNLLISMIVFIL